MIAVILAVFVIAAVYLIGGSAEGWSQVIATAATALASILAFPLVYCWELSGLMTLRQRNAMFPVILIAIGGLGVVLSLGTIAIGVRALNAPTTDEPEPKPDYAVSAPEQPKSARHYSQSDKDRIADAFYEIKEVMNKQILPISADAALAAGQWEQVFLGSVRVPDELQDLKRLQDNVEALRPRMDEAHVAIRQLLESYQAYDDIIGPVLMLPQVEREQPLVALSMALNDFHDALSTMQELWPVEGRLRERVAQLAKPAAHATRDASAKLNGWAHDCLGRAKQSETALLTQ